LDVQLASALAANVRTAASSGVFDYRQTFIDMSQRQPYFDEAVSGTTKSISAIRTRYAVWQQALEAAIGEPVPMPPMPNA
jgi:hypothetical protein